MLATRVKVSMVSAVAKLDGDADGTQHHPDFRRHQQVVDDVERDHSDHSPMIGARELEDLPFGLDEKPSERVRAEHASRRAREPLEKAAHVGAFAAHGRP